MKNKIMISVVVPVYNLEKYIGKCLDSILKQKYDDYEIIVINDGSTDGSQKIIDQYKLKFSKEKFSSIILENGGAARCRNFGIDKCKGRYIAFVDGDDFIDEDYFEVFVKYIKKYSPDVLVSGNRMVDENDRVISTTKVVRYQEEEKNGKPGMFTAWGKLFKSDFLKRAGCKFPEGKTQEDVSFSLITKYLSNNTIAIPYIGYNYVQRTGSVMHTKLDVKKFPFEEIEDAIKLVLSKLKSDDLQRNSFEFELLYFFAGYIFLYCRGNSLKTLEMICDYSDYILKEYFPDFDKNPLVGLNRIKTLTFIQSFSIMFYVKLCKNRRLFDFVKVAVKHE
ncbi:glycosyltransferase family 2 protein [Eubacterium limosum]|uniref:glycosyltransferase family 2 protein n=1 Tax=Eubacterium limosum TaxID=1736 RepID=UPI0037249231